MKVLQIHSSDYIGGGGGTVAMDRLHRGLRQAGIDSKIMSGRKTLKTASSTAIPTSRRLEKAESYLKKATSALGLNDLHHLNSFQVKHTKPYLEADCLHFHGTHGFFNYLAMPGLTQAKPAIFTLHDMWPMTGHCAYSYDCERWKIGCGQCPYPDSHPAIKRDNTRLEWKLKKWVYSRSNLTIVTVSNWLTELARQSILNCLPIQHIPYGIDTELYQPLDPEQCRHLLGLPPRKKVLMFVALDLSDYRKGPDLLLKSLQSLPGALKAETVLLTLGYESETITDAVGIETFNLGYVRHDRLKAICYSAADLFVCPTRADNLPLVLQESMACGRPMVSFRIGGVPDLVRPGITGYLAEPENVAEFRDNIVQLLEDDSLRHSMSQQCRAVALEEYNLELQVQRHIELYQQVLEKSVAQTRADFGYQSAELHLEERV